jgi:hypothetical protein
MNKPFPDRDTNPYHKAIDLLAGRVAISVDPYDDEREAELVAAATGNTVDKVRSDVFEQAAWYVRHWIDTGDENAHWLLPNYRKGQQAAAEKYDL